MVAFRSVHRVFVRNKTAISVIAFAVEDLPLDRTTTLVPAFAVKDLPWAEHSYDDDDRFN